MFPGFHVNVLYPHQRMRNFFAIIFMLALHLCVAYLLLHKNTAQPIKQDEEREQLIFLDRSPIAELSKLSPPIPTPTPTQLKQSKALNKQQNEKQKKRAVTKPTRPTSTLISPPVNSSTSVMSQIKKARKKRNIVEAEALQQNKEAESAQTAPSENDLSLARMRANIDAANYQHKGTNGIFQILDKGVQTGRFSFRGWLNDSRESTWRTYEVDAGVGGNVELALIRRMIQLIREHYTGDFHWESRRQGRVVVLSARSKDNAALERFLMKEFFEF